MVTVDGATKSRTERVAENIISTTKVNKLKADRIYVEKASNWRVQKNPHAVAISRLMRTVLPYDKILISVMRSPGGRCIVRPHCRRYPWRRRRHVLYLAGILVTNSPAATD